MQRAENFSPVCFYVAKVRFYKSLGKHTYLLRRTVRTINSGLEAISSSLCFQ
jgi:hypothetical protein